MDDQRRTLGERDPNTLRSELALARTLKAQDKLGELIELYDAWGKPEKAATANPDHRFLGHEGHKPGEE